jgi:hypothetical protein
MRANGNTLLRGGRKRGFDRNRLRTVADHYGRSSQIFD